MSSETPALNTDTQRGLRPRTIIIAMVLIVVVVAAVVAAVILLGSKHPGRVRLASLPSEATVGFAGAFPAADEPPLANPIGIAWDGERLFIAESDAGVVSIFDAEGGRMGTITLPAASDVATAYPSVIALAGERLAVVDNAANRVIVVSTEATEQATVIFSLGANGNAPVQPTAVAYADGEFYAADAADGTIKAYDEQGVYLRSLGVELVPALGFIGGIEVDGPRLIVADSNAGRVLVLDAETGEQSSIISDEYALPRAIVRIGDTQLAVLDAFERAVFIVTLDGLPADVIDEESVPDGVMSSPRGITWLDEGSRLYVTDGGLGRIMVFNVRLDSAD